MAACPDEADDFFAFMTTAAAASVGPEHALQIMFGVGGEHDLSERELDHLAGWRDSRPVRVGNGAWRQQQIDVYGELLGATHRLSDQISVIDDDMRRFLVALADTAGAFTQSFGSDDLDASNLMLPIVGFLPADDPRMLATVDAIAARLTDDRGLVYRYRTAEGANTDGLAGEEGTFLLCTFWLAQALALAGRTVQAREVFGQAARYVNDVGLLAEEIDPATGELLGNFPQAFSHIGLVNAAYAIAEAEQRAAAR